jgi:hypothetical protein
MTTAETADTPPPTSSIHLFTTIFPVIRFAQPAPFRSPQAQMKDSFLYFVWNFYAKAGFYQDWFSAEPAFMVLYCSISLY